MAKKDLNARVRYSKTQDAFVIEIMDEDGDWNLSSAYPCKKVEDTAPEAEYLHFSIVNQILQMVELGYHIYKSDIVD